MPTAGAQKDLPREVLLEAKDISFSLPQRKKLHLGIAQYGSGINTPGSTFSIFTQNPATGEVDMEVSLDRFAYALRLPVPEKAAKQYNFVLIPKPELATNTEPIIWTVNDGRLKSCSIFNAELGKIAYESDDILERALAFVLGKSNNSLILPDPEEFHSATPESHRKGDTAYHVKGFRGSKDGYLFFLSTGIFFGFKKPLAFFAFDDIESISYTSVLQRTFNLNIAYRPAGANSVGESDMDAIQEVEFAMLDQADFPGIDAYVKRHGLQDASLAEVRRAKKLANGKTAPTQTDEGAGDGEDDDNRTELEKAQQQLEDEEDEEEEDYDPGSDGESEGSGYSDDDDDDDDEAYDREYEREKKKSKGRDLVKDELGSEAEDVSVTEDEEEGEGEEQGEEVGDEEGDEEGEGYDDEEEEQIEDEEEPVPADTGAHHGSSGFTAIPVHGGGAWKHEAGMPDPNDEDQL